MAKRLYMDVETYSSVDIKTCGAYKYIESPDFEIIILCYAIDDEDPVVVDLLQGEEIPEEFEEALLDDDCLKIAHNAVFERLSFNRIGYITPISSWYCTAVKAAYCGLPFSLDEVSKKLNIKDKKLDTGKALIKYFSCPCKPTKINGMRTRNMPEHAPDKWLIYKEYNLYDVLAEIEIFKTLEHYEIPQFERDLYVLDQQINDRGILIDVELAESAIAVDEEYTKKLTERAKYLTNLENPNSPLQVRNWIEGIINRGKGAFEEKEFVSSLAKAEIPVLIEKHSDKPVVVEVLEIRQKLSRSSVKKYYAMLNCLMSDSRVRGTFQFYGASRTGRWAGRLLQLQNLSKNHLDDIDLPRNMIRKRDVDGVEMMYDDVADILSQLVRTALIAPKGKTFAVADFSAIEARVVSWLADEEWRMEVFRGDGKIYEAAGARMFNVPISAVTKGSDLRAKAKNAELALGYQGSLGAMKRMGGDKMGMSDTEMMSIVHKWRRANPKIVELWQEIQDLAHEAVRYQRRVVGTARNLIFECDGECLIVTLPSGRSLYYRNPKFVEKKVGGRVSRLLCYDGIVQETKQWGSIDTYGGKLTENIVQAISRDLIGYAMLQLNKNGFGITMHVHDEAIAEIPEENAEEWLKKMERIMGTPPDWASDLPLNADGYVTPYYKKD